VRAIVVGGGIFGVTAARSLRRRGLDVTLLDPAPVGVPHVDAESTDISKVVRIDYGADEDYTALGEQSLALWRQSPLFHETGVMFISREPMAGFELDSYSTLRRRGHELDRLDAHAIADRFPAWKRGAYVDGYYNPVGGWAESGAVVAAWNADARREGVDVRRSTVTSLDLGAGLDADLIVLAAGSWVAQLLPELAPYLRAVGQPVYHLAPRDRSLFEAARFPVFGADISRTGYYGFPLNRGVVKIANHGTGTSTVDDEPLREMLRATFPALVDAPIVARRICTYCDTVDGNFWIARDPKNPKLVVATGGSGHAFKFAPVLGDIIASISLGDPHPLEHKFRWRTQGASPAVEAARYAGQP
jgi:glycine/D-amino acid oxidase-like deaminating enzyme